MEDALHEVNEILERKNRNLSTKPWYIWPTVMIEKPLWA